MLPPGMIPLPKERKLIGSAAIEHTFTFSRTEQLVSLAIDLSGATAAGDVLIGIKKSVGSPWYLGITSQDLGTTGLDNSISFFGSLIPIYLFNGDTFTVVFANGNNRDYQLVLTTIGLE